MQIFMELSMAGAVHTGGGGAKVVKVLFTVSVLPKVSATVVVKV